jgi:hypothetical protein
MQIWRGMSRQSKSDVVSGGSERTLELAEASSTDQKAPDPDLATSVILRYKNTPMG